MRTYRIRVRRSRATACIDRFATRCMEQRERSPRAPRILGRHRAPASPLTSRRSRRADHRCSWSASAPSARAPGESVGDRNAAGAAHVHADHDQMRSQRGTCGDRRLDEVTPADLARHGTALGQQAFGLMQQIAEPPAMGDRASAASRIDPTENVNILSCASSGTRSRAT